MFKHDLSGGGKLSTKNKKDGYMLLHYKNILNDFLDCSSKEIYDLVNENNAKEIISYTLLFLKEYCKEEDKTTIEDVDNNLNFTIYSLNDISNNNIRRCILDKANLISDGNICSSLSIVFSLTILTAIANKYNLLNNAEEIIGLCKEKWQKCLSDYEEKNRDDQSKIEAFISKHKCFVDYDKKILGYIKNKYDNKHIKIMQDIKLLPEYIKADGSNISNIFDPFKNLKIPTYLKPYYLLCVALEVCDKYDFKRECESILNKYGAKND